jgi:hypothetical protein
LGLLLPTTVQPVLADSTQNITDKSGSFDVSYIIGQKYKVTIPTTITLTDQSGTKGTGSGTVTIKAGEDLKISPDETLAVAIKAGQTLKLGIAGDENLPYAVSKGSTSGGASVAADGATFISADAGATTDVAQDLYIESAAPKLAGTYAGTLTFTVSVVPFLEVSSTAPNSEFDFAGARWRILATDMDPNTEGNQALVIKTVSLTQAEVTGSGATTGEHKVKFRNGDYYFSSNGANGYEAGNGNTAYAKGAIDNWYTSAIASDPELVKYVNPVELHNPTFTDFKDETVLSFYYSDGAVAPFTYRNWRCHDWYTDERFATTVSSSGDKQAFALSYGDINATMGLRGSSNQSDLLKFAGGTFWLRSAGHGFNNVGHVKVDAGTFDNYMDSIVSQPHPVRPALSLNIK